MTLALALALALALLSLTNSPPPPSQPRSTPAPATPSALRPTLVQFTAPYCAACKRMRPALAALHRECGGRDVKIREHDLTRPRGRIQARRMGVQGVPTFIFLDGQGREVTRLVGYQELADLRRAMELVAGDRCAGLGGLEDQFEAGSCGGVSGASC